MPQPIVIPEPSGVFAEPWSGRKLLRLMAVFGPAAIVASVAIGAGETIIVVRAGSWAAYDLLWLVVLSVLVKGIAVTYLLGRYTAISGEPIGQRLVRFPGPRGWLLVVIAALELAAAGPLWAAIVRPCGDLIYHLLQLSHVLPAAADANSLFAPDTWRAAIATLFIVMILAMSLRLTYERLERQQVILCGILVAGTIIGTVLVRPDLSAALAGALNFGHLPRELPAWAPADVRDEPLLTMVTTFGYVGGTVMGYIVYANWIGLHGWGLCGHAEIESIRRRAAAGRPADYLPDDPTQAKRLRRRLAPLKWDVALGAAVLLIVTASFMMAGAAVLYPLLAAGQLDAAFQDWSLLTDQAHIWRNIHPALVWVYYVCVLAALWGTLHAFPEIYSRVTHEFCTAIWPGRVWPVHKLQRAICIYVLAVTVPLLWLEVNFAPLTWVVAFLATNASVALAMVAALWLNFQLPPLYRTGWWMLALGVFSAAILIAVSAISGWGLWRQLVAYFAAN